MEWTHSSVGMPPKDSKKIILGEYSTKLALKEIFRCDKTCHLRLGWFEFTNAGDVYSKDLRSITHFNIYAGTVIHKYVWCTSTTSIHKEQLEEHGLEIIDGLIWSEFETIQRWMLLEEDWTNLKENDAKDKK